MHFHIITLFPGAFDSYLKESILGRAIRGDKPRRPKGSGHRPQASGKIKVNFYNPRDFAEDKWKRIDRPPYGGGPGMVVQALPVVKAIAAAQKKTRNKKQGTKIIWLTPGGKQFDNKRAKTVAQRYKHVIIICGRYEGIDARVKKIFKVDEISVGPFVLTGGELPAMIIMDAVSRQIRGVLGNFDSVEERRIAGKDTYTRPEELQYKGKKYKVPKILLSGHRAKIDEWKKDKGR